MQSAIGIVLPLLLWTLPSPAGPPVSERPTDGAAHVAASVDVTLFNVEVVVTDGKGNVVHGLTADDFEVRHDGKPVRLTNFHEVRAESDSATSPAAPPADARGAVQAEAPAVVPRPPRRVVLFFDRLQIPEPSQRKQLFDSIRRFLEKTLGEGDEAMIVTWNRSIRTVLPFTDDPEQLEESLAVVEKLAVRMPSERAELDTLERENAWFSSLAADPRIGTDFGGSILEAENAAQQAFFEMKAKTAALKGIAATLGGMDGRKALVFVSHRFSRYAGLEFFLQSTGPSSTADPKKVLDRDSRAKVFDTKRLLDEVTRAANAGGVTLYAVLPTSLDEVTPSAEDFSGGLLAERENAQETFQNEMQALTYVAEKTGGVAAAGRLSAPSFLDRVSSDLASWYSLGYPSRSDTTRVAPISVRMKDRRLTARVRTSVVEKSVEEQMKDRVLAQLFRPDARARVPITVTSAATPGPGGKTRIRLEIQVPIGALVLLPTAKGVSGAFSVLVAAVSPDGAFSEITRRSQPFEIAAADLDTAKAGHYTYELEIDANGPEARVSVGVWDEKGNEAGFAVVNAAGSPAPTPIPSPE